MPWRSWFCSQCLGILFCCGNNISRVWSVHHDFALHSSSLGKSPPVPVDETRRGSYRMQIYCLTTGENKTCHHENILWLKLNDSICTRMQVLPSISKFSRQHLPNICCRPVADLFHSLAQQCCASNLHDKRPSFTWSEVTLATIPKYKTYFSRNSNHTDWDETADEYLEAFVGTKLNLFTLGLLSVVILEYAAHLFQIVGE